MDTEAKCCRVVNCATPLVVGVNWFASQAKKHNYICRPCNNKCSAESARANPERTREKKRRQRAANLAKHKDMTPAQITARAAHLKFHCCRCKETFGPEVMKIDLGRTHAIGTKCTECARKANAENHKANPEKFRTRDSTRRARKVNAPAPQTPQERLAVREIYADARLAEAFTGTRMAVDHRISLALGGGSVASNLQILPWAMNASKGSKSHEDSLTQVAGYREWTEGPPTFESITSSTKSLQCPPHQPSP